MGVRGVNEKGVGHVFPNLFRYQLLLSLISRSMHVVNQPLAHVLQG